MADEDTKQYDDCGPSNKELGINYGELRQHIKKHGTDPRKKLYPLRGILLIKNVIPFNVLTRIYEPCDVCDSNFSVRCKDDVNRCKQCRLRYAVTFRRKPWRKRALE